MSHNYLGTFDFKMKRVSTVHFTKIPYLHDPQIGNNNYHILKKAHNVITRSVRRASGIYIIEYRLRLKITELTEQFCRNRFDTEKLKIKQDLISPGIKSLPHLCGYFSSIYDYYVLRKSFNTITYPIASFSYYARLGVLYYSENKSNYSGQNKWNS